MKYPSLKNIVLIIIPAIVLFSCENHTKIAVNKTYNEFDRRLEMAYDRLVSDSLQPVFSKPFIMEDVSLDPAWPRRFSDYSGDLSGRYIEVMSLMAKEGKDKKFLDDIVHSELAYQQPDGRFGNPSLDFHQPDITGEHMALLWGNGRMLVGLMAYYQRTKDPEVLKAAEKLGNFYLGTYRYCSTPENIERLKNFGAMGIICFTQYIEGLAELYKVTGNKDYLDVCRKVYPLLPPRGDQHAHGYLTTLRGVLKLYEITKDSADLNFVLTRYNDLVNSNDLTIYGSVMEFFGNTGTRDEGCATADFVRLSIGLYDVTGENKFLRRAENAMYNALYFNQYETGDFGHHELLPDLTHKVSDPAPGNHIKALTGASSYYRMAAWWCCTMHGLRCLYSLKDHMITFRNGAARLDLFLETAYHENGLSVRIDRELNNKYPLFLTIHLDSLGGNDFEIRDPYWASGVEFSVNGKRVTPVLSDGYFSFPEKLKPGDVITAGLGFTRRFADAMGTPINNLPDHFTGYFYYGPFLMGIDDNTDPVFMAEPNNNIISLETVESDPSGYDLEHHDPYYIPFRYQHSGFPSDLESVMRPVKDIAFEKMPMLQIRFDFQRSSQSGT